jgi:hypothetical protein
MGLQQVRQKPDPQVALENQDYLCQSPSFPPQREGGIGSFHPLNSAELGKEDYDECIVLVQTYVSVLRSSQPGVISWLCSDSGKAETSSWGSPEKSHSVGYMDQSFPPLPREKLGLLCKHLALCLLSKNVFTHFWICHKKNDSENCCWINVSVGGRKVEGLLILPSFDVTSSAQWI